MNSHVHRFYRKFADEQEPLKLFHDVIALHEAPNLKWADASKIAPALPKGWHELCQLSSEDRIEFVRDFWLATLPFIPHIYTFLQDFFSCLDDVGVYLTQHRFDGDYEAEIVYSLRDGSTFYHGGPPCAEEVIEQVQLKFDRSLPSDYLCFLKVHDGFTKNTDTGLIRSKHLRGVYEQLLKDIESQEIVVRGRPIDPKGLIPFYESFGKPSYQCFYTGWIPVDGAGNVYFSIPEKTVSDFMDRECLQEKLAFPSFLDWLIIYLESVGV